MSAHGQGPSPLFLRCASGKTSEKRSARSSLIALPAVREVYLPHLTHDILTAVSEAGFELLCAALKAQGMSEIWEAGVGHLDVHKPRGKDRANSDFNIESRFRVYRFGV